MATHFHSLKIQEVRRETRNTVSILFEVPEELREAYQYIPGQYLTLRAQIGGEELRRSYSICSSPDQGELRVALKEVPGGKFSTWANQQLAAGMDIDVMPPLGHFKVSEKQGIHLGFAAGSGITPVLSIIRSVLKTSETDRFVLYYGNKKWEDIIFREELTKLEEQYAGRLQVHHVLSQEQRPGSGFGRLDKTRLESAFVQGLQIKDLAATYLCGPSEMIFSLRDALEAKGLENDRIHYELFTIPVVKEGTAVVASAPVDATPSEGLTATYVLDGERVEVKVTDAEQTILDIGLTHGIDLPFACQGGVCCTCRAKVISGKVDMRQNFSLGDSEVKEGYVLTCQSYPMGVDTVIDYDA